MEYRISLPTKTCMSRLFVLSWQCRKEEREKFARETTRERERD
jgi:hypothetical protein